MLSAKGGNAVLNVFSNLGADFETEDEGVREERGERDEETAEAAADVCYCDGLCEGFGFVRGGGVDVGWVVGGPVHLGGTGGARGGEGWLVRLSVLWGGYGAGGVYTRSIGGRRRGWRGRVGGRISSWGGRCWGWLGGFCGILRAFGAWLGEAMGKGGRPYWLRSNQSGATMCIVRGAVGGRN